jgi:hypothetical protein
MELKYDITNVHIYLWKATPRRPPRASGNLSTVHAANPGYARKAAHGLILNHVRVDLVVQIRLPCVGAWGEASGPLRFLRARDLRRGGLPCG